MDDIRSRTRAFIIDKYIYDPGTAESLTDDLPLVDEGIVDSFGMYDLIMFIENQFDVKIKDEEVVLDNLGSIEAIANFVTSKQNGQSTR